MTHDCPLCGLEFEYEVCHSTCPMARGCKMVRCPRCSYEFVEEGLLLSFIRRIVKFEHERTAVILSRRSAAKELKLRGTSHMRRILSSFAVYAAQDDGINHVVEPSERSTK